MDRGPVDQEGSGRSKGGDEAARHRQAPLPRTLETRLGRSSRTRAHVPFFKVVIPYDGSTLELAGVGAWH